MDGTSPLRRRVTLIFALPAHAVTIDWVAVGISDPCGAVPYVYRISRYETTNAQYTEFLNAVATTDTYSLYNTLMGSPDPWDYGGITRSGSSGSYAYSTIAGRENMPVNYVSFYDSLRFANWLHNAQLSGAQNCTTTEDGAYTFSGATSVGARNPGATIFLTSEDEWYKAAYYDAVYTSYFHYPANSDTKPVCTVPGATPNTANCQSVNVYDLTDVGSYTGSASPNGTFDQGGNVWEWNEMITGSDRVRRAGSFADDALYLQAKLRRSGPPSGEYASIGFRVARVPDCIDSVDNDEDSLIDYPNDPGCTDAQDLSEEPDCEDGFDNDGDGVTDHPDDPGCADADDLSERSPLLQCDDEADNDGDGRIDYPNDPGCSQPRSHFENP